MTYTVDEADKGANTSAAFTADYYYYIPAATTTAMSRKRIRAHANPLSDVDCEWPLTPSHIDWTKLYPDYHATAGANNASSSSTSSSSSSSSSSTALTPVSFPAVISSTPLSLPPPPITMADIGCGFGGLLISLSEIFRNELILGIELRDKVVEIVVKKINQIRDNALNERMTKKQKAASSPDSYPTQSASPSPPAWASLTSSYQSAAHPPFKYDNVSCLHSNIMRFSQNIFPKHSLHRLFFLFQDPHFKRSNHKRRVLVHQLIDFYSYSLRPGGLIYIITDVKDLFDFQYANLKAHPLYQEIEDKVALAKDPCYLAIHEATEEGQKVKRQGGSKWAAVFRRIKGVGEEWEAEGKVEPLIPLTAQ